MASSLLFLLLVSLTVNLNEAIDAYSSVRRDYFLPDKQYPEEFAATPTGGRVHIVYTTAATAPFKMPYTASFDITNLSSIVVSSSNEFINETGLDWIHCDTNPNTKQVFISFHTKLDTILDAISTVTVKDTMNKSLGTANFTLNPIGHNFSSNYPLTVTYVTTDNNYKQFIVHLHNYDDTHSFYIDILKLNGLDIDKDITLAPNEHIIKIYNVTTEFSEGDVWTIGLSLSNGLSLGFGGRIMKEFYAFESWGKSSQCPFPGANTSNFLTFYNDLKLNIGFIGGTCNTPINTIFDAIQNITTNNGPYKLLLGDGYTSQSPNQTSSKYFNEIIALELGDEVDGNVKNTFSQNRKSLLRREWYPSLVTYQG